MIASLVNMTSFRCVEKLIIFLDTNFKFDLKTNYFSFDVYMGK